MHNKKASLEISIQAIVIVVLAMTLLGLGLGFIRGMFKNITGATEDVTEQVRQRVVDDLVTGDKKVSFTKTEITVDKGSSTILTVGIRNKENFDLDYKMRFSAVSGPGSDGTIVDLTPDALDEWFQFDKDTGYKLSPANVDVRNIRINVPKSAFSGSYFLTFDVIDIISSSSDPPYAQKDFFIVVIG